MESVPVNKVIPGLMRKEFAKRTVRLWRTQSIPDQLAQDCASALQVYGKGILVEPWTVLQYLL